VSAASIGNDRVGVLGAAFLHVFQVKLPYHVDNPPINANIGMIMNAISNIRTVRRRFRAELGSGWLDRIPLEGDYPSTQS